MEILYEVTGKTGKITWAVSEYFGELSGQEYQLSALEATDIVKITSLSETARLLLSAAAGAVIQHLLDKNIPAETIFATGKIIFPRGDLNENLPR